MSVVKSWLMGGFLGVFAAVGCGDSDKHEDLSGATPAELCQRRCALEVAANCAKTPSDFASSCALLCQAKYDKFPNCSAAARALDVCTIQRVSYGCESDVIAARPVGACALEGLSCGSCTGDLLECL